MSYFVDNKRRLAREKNQAEKMDIVKRTKVIEDFPNIFRLSAILGYYFGDKKHLPKVQSSAEKVQLSFFENTDYNFIDMLAYSITKNQNIIKEQGKDNIYGDKYDIYESCVKKGFDVLYSFLDLDKEKLVYSDDEKFELLIRIIGLLKNPSDYKDLNKE